MMSVALYLVIARNVLSNPKFAAGLSLAETLRILLWGLAVVDLGYFAWWKKNYLTRAALLDRAKQAKLFSALEEHEGPVEERAAFVVSTYVTRKVVLFAIIDALAVYGLVLAIVGRYVADQYLLSGLTLILLILEFPSQRSMKKALGDLEQASP